MRHWGRAPRVKPFNGPNHAQLEQASSKEEAIFLGHQSIFKALRPPRRANGLRERGRLKHDSDTSIRTWTMWPSSHFDKYILVAMISIGSSIFIYCTIAWDRQHPDDTATERDSGQGK